MTDTKNDLTESQRIIEEDWRLFRELTHMKNHWDRPDWPFGRRAYYWYLTFEDNGELGALARTCQAVLASQDFDLVPAEELHMTVDRIGWADEVSDNQIDAIVKVAAVECGSVSKFEIEVGPLAGSAGAVRFSATPWRPIVALRDALRRATRTVIPDAKPDDGTFRPHVGIGYCGATVLAEPVIRLVESTRAQAPAQARVGVVSLVVLERQQHSWRWEVRHRLDLS